MKNILLIDDHAVVREGIKSALIQNNLHCVGEASSKGEALAQIAHHNPDAIVVDLNLPDGNGLEIVSWARKISQTIGIVVLTLHDSDQYLQASMQAGANAHILKSAPVTELIAAIEHSIAAPLSFIGVGYTRQLAAKKDNYSLTARELTIWGYLKSGNENKEIAEHLFLTQSTVKTHLSSIYRKLEVDNRTQAVEFARKHALL